MATVEVVNLDNKKVGSAELSSDLFERAVRKDILQTVVKWQLAKKRQGTHKAKTRTEVSGGGAKPYKQKGTGNARRGSTRSPLIRGGGVIFGPNPRNYAFAVPKKIRKAAVKYALSHLYKTGKVIVVDSLESKDGKTKGLVSQLSGMGLKKSVLLGGELNENFERASRNIPKFVYQPVEGVNVYDLLKYDGVVLEQASLAKLEERLGAEA
ncbi:MAG: 50S ribosomal protein L4 [Bdellovibrionales bacterium]